jgi:hypothetical protein
MARLGSMGLVGSLMLLAACGGSKAPQGDGGAGAEGGTAGASEMGGARAKGAAGANETGGAQVTGAAGAKETGGAQATAGRTGSGGTHATGGRTGSGGADAAGGSSSSGGSAGHSTTLDVDLCEGLVTDQEPHSMTPLDKPTLGDTVLDQEFGTTIRRITAVSGANQAIVPMYSTISAWNADESRMVLYEIGSGHQLYDGKSYERIGALDIDPPDLEQVYWDTSDPDLLYYVDGQTFIRYHVGTGKKDELHDFSSLCGSEQPSNGSDPMFTSWDSHRLGLVCGQKMFVYDSSTDTVLGPAAPSGTPPAQVAPSGTLAYLEAGTGQILSVPGLALVRSLDLQVPDNHASLGQLANGHDTWNGAVYDDGNDDEKSDVGILVTWDLVTGTGGAVIGPKTGYPYPPDGHVSAMAYRQPGWVFVSTIWTEYFDGRGTPPTPGLLDLENLVANTNTGVVCRIGRHRSWGKTNTALSDLDSYWAEPHTVPSPSGTRAVFASDWGNGDSVDSYVVELPSYVR